MIHNYDWKFGEDLDQDPRNPKRKNELDNKLITMSNILARARTKWTIEESKLFLCALAKVKTRDLDNWVVLNKVDVQRKLGIDPRHGNLLRTTIRRVMEKSFVNFNGNLPNEDFEWHDGFLLTDARADKNTLSVRFNDTFIPLMEDLSEHFTQFYLDNVISFSKKSSYNLYVYLCSWFNGREFYAKEQKLLKEDIAQVFGLPNGMYWRNIGKPNAYFHFGDFERRCLVPAIDEINGTKSCDMEIVKWEKIKDGHNVVGYSFTYVYNDRDGHRK